jgi:MFS transporter, DHA1 family, inner membrane transport protein
VVRLTPVRKALLALAVGGFGIGTGEFVIIGLLPNIARDLSVSIPQAGHLISSYALGVVVGAPTLTALSVRLPRRTVLLALMSAFALGNLFSALAPNYEWLLLARFVSALPHGAYFGVGSVMAAGLVHESRRSAAMSVMFTGLTVANIVGVPLTTLLGQHTSWRLVFAAVAGIGALSVAAMAVTVPRSTGRAGTPNLRGEMHAFRNRQIWLALGIATFGGGGMFATFSYITPMMTHIAGYAESSVTPLLVLFGLGMTAGNLYGARLADRSLRTALFAGISAEIVVALLFLVTSHNEITAAATIFLFPAAGMMMLPALQTKIIGLAGGAPNLAAASIHSAFNIANSLGAWLGGAVIAAGLGYNAPNAVAAGLAAVGMILVLISVQLARPPQVVPHALVRAECVAPSLTAQECQASDRCCSTAPKYSNDATTR